MHALAITARRLAIVAVLPLAAVTCDAPTAPNHASSPLTDELRPGDGGSARLVAIVNVKIMPERIAVGQAAFAGARAIDENGLQQPSLTVSSWTSSNPAVATVASNGFVRGLANGVADITATIEGVRGTARLVVGTGVGPVPDPTATALALATQPQGGTAGGTLSVQPVVEVHDANGQRVPGSSVPVTASIATGNGTLGGTVTVHAVDGVARFGDLAVTGTGEFRLAFTATGLAAVTSAPFTIGALPATQLGLRVQPGGAVSGSPLQTQPVVEIRNASNGIVPGSAAPVTATIASGTGTLAGTTTVQAQDGVARFTDLRIIGAGTFSLRFTSPGLTDVISATFTAAPAPPTQLALVTPPSSAASSGAIFAVQPVIALRDAMGGAARVAGVVVTAAIASGGGTLGGNTSVTTDAMGVATFTNLSIAGETGTRTLVFSAPGLQAVTSPAIVVTNPLPPPEPPPGALSFASDWSSAAGESSNAVTDGGRWTVIGNTEDRVTVIPSTGLGFPAEMSNVLRIRHRTSHAVGVYVERGWRAPAVGEHLYYRMYIRMSIAQADPPPLDNSAHPIMARPGTGAFAMLQNLGSTFRWTFAFNNQPNDFTHRFSFNAQRDAVYRFEVHFHRVTSTTAAVDIRVYDRNDVLVATSADLPCTAGHMAPHTLADIGTIVFPSAGTWDGLTGMTISHEGANWGPFSDDRMNMNYYGGIAVSHSGWVGPYRRGQGR